MKRLLSLSLAVLILACIIFFGGRVTDDLTPDDRDAINTVFAGATCESTVDFASQYACIKSLQAELRRRLPNSKCAPEGENIEPKEFLSRGHGCCYDRARILEKALVMNGFKIRHAAMYQKDRYGRFAVVVPGVPSHAALEALTEKGWMGVDSIEGFVLLAEDGRPLTYRDFFSGVHRLKEPVTPVEFYSKPLMVVYGLYSRHGQFHGVGVPVPEINYSQFLAYNFSD